MPTALITGASGQDGGYLVDRLLADSWAVCALVRKNDASSLPDVVRSFTGDLRDAAGLSRIVTEAEPDAVFHLAGLSSVALSWKEPVLTAEVTGTAVAALLEASLALQESTGREVRFVQASSSEIFGAATENPQTEATPLRPVSPYGAAKAFAHHLVGVYRGRGLHASSGILYNHESPRRPMSFVTRKITAGVAAIAVGAETGLSLGNLDVRRDWGWAPDYVDALVRASLADTPGDYIVATGVAHSVREFVAAAFTAVGINDWEHLVSLDPRFARPVDTPEMRGDASRAREVLGWAPTVGFEEIVARMVEHDLELARRAR
ncbi:GDP-mannose 4,6-dehydratase [Rathayibacter toxicus]|uniref:GDP-mannose 4,6-dehydratase n=1 Tax=Rathayibacter toxicus TaxID=145458 RepID=A0A0C5BTN7_9MICO|nr:GDP-mannose 4,6-dehydratase [Rathayibacter toxicus]AJM78012.1 GDP-D-mannose dehydratase [Rathayibacter toxicus]ALS57765.1 GDP-mannose 4,6 dehydratase [Rathayibacter toxicus]KKM47343.1 GDP-D-mannose dehydratase [Rathayibacter toxicus]PPG20564.1 GDP-mannose 4,6-dehydratase [Rathayibacter toxicus]PPG45666.1 GDP-mannose 4,6-dehydratase [Rathayibacter toxicus]